MDQVVRSVEWEAPEHTHSVKSSNWYFALAIVVAAVAAAAVILNNFLFALLAVISGASLAVAAAQTPRIIQYGVSARGIRVDNALYPFASLRSFYISEEDPRGHQLLVVTDRSFSPMLVIPIPEEYTDEIEALLSSRVAEEYLEEPLFNHILERLGL